VTNPSADAAIHTPPEGPSADLCCPLCEYSLRGLAEPRCPECGFAFSWAELRAADRNRHPWLFEHADRHRLRSFWTTYWRDALPWRFWREVTPASPVNLRRLFLYWSLSSLAASALLLVVPHGLWWAYFFRWLGPALANWGGSTVQFGPFDWFWYACEEPLDNLRRGRLWPDLIGPVLLVIAWPWLSMATLLVFTPSALQIWTRPPHLVRAVVYGCDFGPTVAIAVGLLLSIGDDRHDGIPLACLTLFCGVLATVRLTFALGRQDRFRKRLAIALASQILVVLFVWMCLALTTDMSDLSR
jgi:hypothetical protein